MLILLLTKQVWSLLSSVFSVRRVLWRVSTLVSVLFCSSKSLTPLPSSSGKYYYYVNWLLLLLLFDMCSCALVHMYWCSYCSCLLLLVCSLFVFFFSFSSLSATRDLLRPSTVPSAHPRTSWATELTPSSTWLLVWVCWNIAALFLFWFYFLFYCFSCAYTDFSFL